jgi:programmed cell death 8 (apoptosis-inducing factor)
VAAGITPDLEFAKQSQLEIDEKRNGILVNAELEARSNVFAAGDAASFHDVYLGRRRIEHYVTLK